MLGVRAPHGNHLKITKKAVLLVAEEQFLCHF